MVVLTVLFILSLVVILYLSYTKESTTGGFDISKPYPPVQQKCPDLWSLSGTSVCVANISASASENRNKNLGSFVNANGVYAGNQVNLAKREFNLTSLQTSGSVSTGVPAKIQFDADDKAFGKNTSMSCGRKQFAKMMNLYWEGLDNYGPC